MSDQHNNSVCPNCGAPMERDRFSSVCRYCGTSLESNTPTEPPTNHKATGSARKHYDYIVANEMCISQSQLVALQKEKNRYTLTSKPFYANDGFLNPLSSSHWRLQFQCDGRTEKLLLGISGKRPASRMAIKLNGDKGVLILPIQHFVNGYTWFKLTESQLLDICTSKDIDLSTDLTLPSNAHFNEFPIFAARFYNAAFNRMKFMYSVHVNLITDN